MKLGHQGNWLRWLPCSPKSSFERSIALVETCFLVEVLSRDRGRGENKNTRLPLSVWRRRIAGSASGSYRPVGVALGSPSRAGEVCIRERRVTINAQGCLASVGDPPPLVKQLTLSRREYKRGGAWYGRVHTQSRPTACYWHGWGGPPPPGTRPPSPG